MKWVVVIFTLFVGCGFGSSSVNNTPSQAGPPQSFPITALPLQNCHFTNAAPVYSLSAPIQPNPIVCGTGVPLSAQIISPTDLPEGLYFTQSSLALTGTPTVAVQNATFTVYVQNSAGYLKIPLQITVQ